MPHLLSETLVWCVTLLLFGMGLIGTLIPMLPGIMIIAAGCVWQGVMGRKPGVVGMDRPGAAGGGRHGH